MLHSTFRVKLNERKRLKCGREKIEELIIIKKPKIRLGRRLTYYDRSRLKLKYLCAYSRPTKSNKEREKIRNFN